VASKRKSNNPITKTNDSTTNSSGQNSVKQLFMGDYFNIHTFQRHPITPSFFGYQAKLLKEWADQDDSLRISDFYDKQGYGPEFFYYWVDKDHDLKAANSYALRRIGSRREGGAMTRKFSENTVHKTLGHYDPIWREEMRLINEARLAIAEKSESKIVVIERFPSASNEYQDVEVVSTSKLSPQEVASNIRRNIATDREVKVNMKGKSHD
jgi:hypothetical protein